MEQWGHFRRVNLPVLQRFCENESLPVGLLESVLALLVFYLNKDFGKLCTMIWVPVSHSTSATYFLHRVG